MINQHISVLIHSDSFFNAYWEALTPDEREKRLDLTRKVESIWPGSEASARTEYKWASEKARRYFSCVPQKEFEYSRRPRDWMNFVAKGVEKERLYEFSLQEIKTFLSNSRGAGGCRVYGGVKPLASLDAGLEHPKVDSVHRRGLRDAWDAVRFRIVCSDMIVVRVVCVEMWQHYIDEIIGCRNYYVTAGGAGSDLYRAVHFELEIVPGRWIEIQVLTEPRDWVGFLDHSFLFKKRLRFMSREHENWLVGFSLRANVMDARVLPDADVSIPPEILRRYKKLLKAARGPEGDS